MSRVETITTLEGVAEFVNDAMRWEWEWSDNDRIDLNNVISLVKGTLDDIGLNPDRKYSIEEIARLKAAIEWALS